LVFGPFGKNFGKKKSADFIFRRCFAKQIHLPVFSLPSHRAKLAIDSLSDALCSATSRQYVFQCIPFGLPPAGFDKPGCHSNRSRILLARRRARCSAVSRWLR
jgi:hypothetical protein